MFTGLNSTPCCTTVKKSVNRTCSVSSRLRSFTAAEVAIWKNAMINSNDSSSA